MNDNTEITLKAWMGFEIFSQSTKLRSCEVKIPVFGVQSGGGGRMLTNFVAKIVVTASRRRIIDTDTL